jgi:hypothetical protein
LYSVRGESFPIASGRNRGARVRLGASGADRRRVSTHEKESLVMTKILIGSLIAAASLSLGPLAMAQDIGPAVKQSEADVHVQQEVRDALMNDERLASAMLVVSVLEGRVSVTGMLHDVSQETEIYRVARKVPGVRQVTVFADSETQ